MSKELVVRMQPMQIAIFIKVLNTDFFSFWVWRIKDQFFFNLLFSYSGNICKNCHVIQNPILHYVSGFSQYYFKEIYLETV